jgi:hypothetical protein
MFIVTFDFTKSQYYPKENSEIKPVRTYKKIIQKNILRYITIIIKIIIILIKNIIGIIMKEIKLHSKNINVNITKKQRTDITCN